MVPTKTLITRITTRDGAEAMAAWEAVKDRDLTDDQLAAIISSLAPDDVRNAAGRRLQASETATAEHLRILAEGVTYNVQRTILPRLVRIMEHA